MKTSPSSQTHQRTNDEFACNRDDGPSLHSTRQSDMHCTEEHCGHETKTVSFQKRCNRTHNTSARKSRLRHSVESSSTSARKSRLRHSRETILALEKRISLLEDAISNRYVDCVTQGWDERTSPSSQTHQRTNHSNTCNRIQSPAQAR